MSDLNKNREDARDRLKQAIDAKMSFLTHLVIFILVNFFVLLPNSEIGKINNLPLPTIAWGIGLIMHFLRVFVYNNEYIEKQIDQKMEEKKKY